MKSNLALELRTLLYCFVMIILSGILVLPGLLLTGPVIFVLEHLSELERLKALKGSKVKISGKDVVASYKIMISSVIFPLTSLVFTVVLFLFLWFYEFQRVYQYTLMFFFVWPMYLLVAIRSNDGLVRHLFRFLANLMMICDRKTIAKLQEARGQLKVNNSLIIIFL